MNGVQYNRTNTRTAMGFSNTILELGVCSRVTEKYDQNTQSSSTLV